MKKFCALNETYFLPDRLFEVQIFSLSGQIDNGHLFLRSFFGELIFKTGRRATRKASLADLTPAGTGWLLLVKNITVRTLLPNKKAAWLSLAFDDCDCCLLTRKLSGLFKLYVCLENDVMSMFY